MNQVSTANSLQRYKQAIAKVPLLSAAEERALAQTIKEGSLELQALEASFDPGSVRSPIDLETLKSLVLLRKREVHRTKTQLIEANLRLVISIAKQHKGWGLPLQDLIQEGNLGLIKAVDKFDYQLGYRLSTYASWWIRQGIRQALDEQGSIIRIPVHQLRSMRRAHKDQRHLAQLLGREPTHSEWVQHLEPAEMQHGQNLGFQELISTPTEVMDLGTDPLLDSPLQCTALDELKKALRQQLLTLKPREAKILSLRFGVDGEEHTLEAIGAVFNMTRERVRQIESAALRKLKSSTCNKPLEGFVETLKRA